MKLDKCLILHDSLLFSSYKRLYIVKPENYGITRVTLKQENYGITRVTLKQENYGITRVKLKQ